MEPSLAHGLMCSGVNGNAPMAHGASNVDAHGVAGQKQTSNATRWQD